MKRKAPALYLLIPAMVMMVIPLWSLLYQICLGPNCFLFPVGPDGGKLPPKYLLLFCGLSFFLLACWLAVEAYRVVRTLTQEHEE
jgi:hypothetical protein